MEAGKERTNEMKARLPTHGNISIAAVVIEAIRSKSQRNKRYMTGIHGLKAETSAVAVEVSIINQVLNGLNHLQTLAQIDFVISSNGMHPCSITALLGAELTNGEDVC